MAGTGKNQIFASRSSVDSGSKTPHVEEAIASVALTPGRLVVLDANGEFALKGAGDDPIAYVVDANFTKQLSVSDDNPADETAVAFLPRDGEKYNVRLATGQALVKGTPLAAAANGQLTVGTPGTNEILFYSDEVVAATTADQLVRVLKA